MLVTHAFKIVDKFKQGEKLTQNKNSLSFTQKKDGPSDDDSGTKSFFRENNFPFQPLEKEAMFDPENIEVCLNISGLIAGVAVFLTVQLVLVFGWTHFWQSRNKKKRDSLSSAANGR